MADMKKFLIYGLLLVGFFVVSNFLERGLVEDMYIKIDGNATNTDTVQVEVIESKATNVNGYLKFKVTNDSNKTDSSIAKIDFLDESGKISMTQYAVCDDLKSNSSKEYKVKFRGEKIKSYNITFVDSLPEKTNMIDMFGWEVDKTNVFGLGIDLTNIFGKDISGYFESDTVQDYIFARVFLQILVYQHPVIAIVGFPGVFDAIAFLASVWYK